MLIRLKQYSFSLSEPFVEGQTLDAISAKQLNALRADRIRDAAAKKLAKILKSKPMLSPVEIVAAQKEIDKIDQTFRFREPKSDDQRLSRLDLAIRDVARERVEEQYRSVGVDPQNVTDDELERGIEAMMELELVQSEGRRRLVERQKVAAMSLEDLL